jgi:CDP-diacylglycerol--glycerol-3-phosphate 3-phosphatidyltransferase
VKPLKALERPFFAVFRPLVNWLIAHRVRPNTITTVGTALVLASAVFFGVGSIRLGGLFLLLSGIVDTIDGQVARNGAMVTRFGAFYDSTLDRIGDGATFAGVGTYLMMAPDVAWRELSVIVCMVGIIASLVVSYARARAEGLGLDCKVGIAQRAERILLLGIPPLLFGAGPGSIYLQVIVVLLTVLALITVVQRIVHVHGAANAADLAGLQDRE